MLLTSAKSMGRAFPSRARSISRLKIVLVVLAACFVVAAAYLSWLIAKQQDDLARVSRLDVAWVANKAESEFFRLQHTLLAYRTGQGGITADDVVLRFEIIQSRFNMLQEGDFGAFISSQEGTKQAAEHLNHIRTAAEPFISRIETPGAADQAAAILEPVATLLPSLVGMANQYVADLITQNHASLTNLHRAFTIMMIGMIACGFGLIAFMKRQNDLLEGAHDEVQELAKNLAHLAHHDALTGLANRVLFRQSLEGDLDTLRSKGQPLTVLYLDLDGFKQVNDKLGHAAGDDVLRIVAKRLQHSIRSGDILARLGGDEFAVLLRDPASVEIAESVSQRIITAISAPIRLDRQEVMIGTSIGIFMAKERGLTRDEIMRGADKALYQAKSEGRGRYRVFDIVSVPDQKVA
ncbi:GGDEF domain-containing protein [Microvirga sp. VF16]|uniref:GGDEF domain-containing protein n=1 Tax=Microvirga sp. VF16 TaxID=2807101 RepID=UPI00193D1F57|nr:GGDEF domain-containing protein [Microvirga sp. VF16]QRM34839.1 GGDEF domain-containing protein [Microvirga sp. VF16]